MSNDKDDSYIEQYWCPDCGDWLFEDSTVHSVKINHEGDPQFPTTWRRSYDDGKTWTQEE